MAKMTKKRFVEILKRGPNAIETVQAGERARIRRAIAPALRELRKIAGNCPRVVPSECETCLKAYAAIATIDDATRAPRHARAKGSR